MGFRFRKSFSPIKGIRINLSKRGLGVSAGVKGARIGVGTKGAYTSVGIPGTGISSLNYIGKGKRKSQALPASQKPRSSVMLTLLFLSALVMIFVYPPVGMFLWLAWIVAGYLHYKKSKNPVLEAAAEPKADQSDE